MRQPLVLVTMGMNDAGPHLTCSLSTAGAALGPPAGRRLCAVLSRLAAHA
ncbi:hypothetical protein ART_4319 [Arthrobacter sp. PAMC 25486]|nr:hypothetical protein ART_4319 [Arthrobacter sp. PAMC 25486]